MSILRVLPWAETGFSGLPTSFKLGVGVGAEKSVFTSRTQGMVICHFCRGGGGPWGLASTFGLGCRLFNVGWAQSCSRLARLTPPPTI